jgi:hypothetical protein
MVEIRLYLSACAVRPGTKAAEELQAFINELVDGLRARLGSGNLLTGQRYVALEFLPKRRRQDYWSRIPRISNDQGGRKTPSRWRIARKIEKCP